MFAADTVSTLETAGRLKLLDAMSCERLKNAHSLYSNFMQIARMTIDGAFDPTQTPESVKRRIASAAGLPDFRSLERDLAEMRNAVRMIFNDVLIIA